MGHGALGMGHWAQEAEGQRGRGAEGKNLLLPCSPAPLLPISPTPHLPTPLISNRGDRL
jgi:hypothetical protein